MFILALAGLAMVFWAIICKAAEGFPYIQHVPVLNELVAWGIQSAGYILPAGVALFIFTSTRSIIWTLAAFFVCLGATVLVFKW